MSEWLMMGGYAAYVWPAYGVAVLILGGLSGLTVRRYRAARRDLARLQEDRG